MADVFFDTGSWFFLRGSCAPLFFPYGGGGHVCTSLLFFTGRHERFRHPGEETAVLFYVLKKERRYVHNESSKRFLGRFEDMAWSSAMKT